jgi:hypothetical protein
VADRVRSGSGSDFDERAARAADEAGLYLDQAECALEAAGLRELLEALSFYADPENWSGWDNTQVGHWDEKDGWIVDMGERAREALGAVSVDDGETKEKS